MEDRESLVLNYGTRPHDIDSRTLIASLSSIETALRQIALTGHPGAEIRIRIKPFRRGSFEIPIEVRQALTSGALVLSSVDWSGARDSIKILLELIKMRMSSKGQKKEVQATDRQVVIEGNEKSTIFVDQRTINIHANDPKIGEALARGFQALNSDEQIKSLTVLDKKRKKLLRVPRRAFRRIAEQVIEKPPKEKTVSERTSLRVFRVVLEDGYKWDFFYQGFKIPVTIEDPNFQDRVSRGERFGRGDILDVDLNITKKYDEGIQAYVNKSYTISKVHKIEARGVQGDLNLNP